MLRILFLAAMNGSSDWITEIKKKCNIILTLKKSWSMCNENNDKSGHWKVTKMKKALCRKRENNIPKTFMQKKKNITLHRGGIESCHYTQGFVCAQPTCLVPERPPK